MKELFESLQKRYRPEDVAQMIVEKLSGLYTDAELRVIQKAASQSRKQALGRFTEMAEEFKKPVPPLNQVEKAGELFRRANKLTAADCCSPVKVRALIQSLGKLISKSFGKSQFKQDRLNREQREAKGFGTLSRRRYNKLFRFLGRFECKLAKYERESSKYEYVLIGKSRLASKLTYNDFRKDKATGAFIAYYTARCNLRSQFTNTAQDRPYDEIADTLFKSLKSSANWWAIAHVYPEREVLDKIGDRRRGALLGQWLGILNGIAQLLREVLESSKINRATMIVARGNDSTTWNNTASAWNRAREAWIALLHSMGMDDELDSMCFGKVLRLIAADVAHWHRSSGGELEPDTKVWRDLPAPWDVLDGSAVCTRATVVEICRRHNIDPVAKGWVARPPIKKVEKFKPTPELVHGVVVSNPALGKVLRKAGWFSGKDNVSLFDDVLEKVMVTRDVHGFAVMAYDEDQEPAVNSRTRKKRT